MRRRRQQLFRGRRTVLATVVGLVVVALAVLGAVAALQIHAGHDATVLGHVSAIATRLREHTWTDPAVLVTGIVCAALGLVLLLAGLLPARRPLLRLSDLEAHTISGISRTGLVRDLTAVAASVDGVTRARVRLRRRHVVVRARSPLRDRRGLADDVDAAIVGRLESLAPAVPLRVSTSIAGARG